MSDETDETDDQSTSDQPSDGKSTSDQPTTLAARLSDETRAVTARDLELVSIFLYETLGRWYELRPDGSPPPVDPADIEITPRRAPAVEPGPALLDSGDRLSAPEATSGDADAANDEGSDDEGSDTPHDERDGVFAASAAMAQVAVGRIRTDDESWDDVIQQLESDDRPSLASALWVGLATEPEARYPTVGQWRRSVDAALRSDAATAAMLDDPDDPRRRTALIAVVAAAVLALVAVGAFVLFGDDSTGTDESEVAAVDSTATTSGASTSNDDRSDTATGTGADTEDGSGSGSLDDGDECALTGPLGPITIDQVGEHAIVVAWAPSTEAVNILLDGAFVDTVPPEAFRYVIEQLPLSSDPLLADTDYTVAVEPQSGDASTACATTLSNPVPGSEVLIGVTAPTGLEVVDTSATSITVGWDLRLGADLHNLYLNGTYIQFGDVGGSSAIGDENEFTFVDLEPDTTYEIGIRRVEGPNQSGLVSVTASTEPG